MARPPKELRVSEDVIKDLASIHCTNKEIANICGCSVDTLERRFADLIEKARDNGRSKLRRAQLELAHKGNATMLIWLGKQLLGQTEKIVQQISADVKVEENKSLVDDLKKLISNELNEKPNK